MTDSRWHRTERLFHAALARPATERATFLAAACPEPDLRAEVLALVAAHDADSPLAGRLHIADILADIAPGPATGGLEPGGTVGPYRVVREIGCGGMGTVVLAERADGAFRHRVALKVVRPELGGVLGATARAQFLRERDTLAGLEHPAIARLLGGGETDAGEPYFAMEYVDGVPVTDFCDGHQMPVEARLDLFLHVCEAVAYAHRRLVVHRDLKPSNVLVAEGDAGPSVKLLDFGIARLLDAADGGDQTALAGDAGRPFTPGYAAPEQVRGEPVGTAADVWALGVLLHRLLADRRPFAVRDRQPDAAEAALAARAEPPSQSAVRPPEPGEPPAEAVAQARATTPERLRRRLAGDLDAVVGRCLRPEPEARYVSADALADDLRRHLVGRPVRARHGTRAYLTGRFVRRHWRGVAAAVLAVVAVTGFAAALAVENRATAREQARAEATAGFLGDVLAGANALQTGRGDVTVAEVLDDAARRVPRAFAGAPDVEAALLLTIGDAYAGLSKFHQAEPVLRRALVLQRTARPGDRSDTAGLLASLGLVAAERGQLDSAAALQREALAMTQRLDGRDAPAAATVLNNLAWVEMQRTRHGTAERLLRRAIAIADRSAPDSVAALDGARARSSLGVLRMRQGRYAEAERLEQAALTVRRRRLGPTHPLVALSLSNLAKLVEDSGRNLERALPYADQALALRLAISGDSSVAVLTSRSNRAAVLRGLGRHAEAVAEAQRATDTAEAVYGPLHTASAYARYNLALARHAAGDRAAAEREYAAALQTHDAIWGRDHSYTAYVLVPYAKLALAAGDAARAARLVRPAVAARRASLDPGSWLTADAEATLGRALLAQDRHADALVLLGPAADVLAHSRGADACPTRLARAALSAARAGRAAPAPDCL